MGRIHKVLETNTDTGSDIYTIRKTSTDRNMDMVGDIRFRGDGRSALIVEIAITDTNGIFLAIRRSRHRSQGRHAGYAAIGPVGDGVELADVGGIVIVDTVSDARQARRPT